MFKKNQTVWCAIYGAGVVVDDEDPGKYPITVAYNIDGEDDILITYTRDGKLLEKGNVALFHYPVKIVRDKALTKKPSIDWSQVKEEYKWLSVDKDGSAYVSTHEPTCNGANYWYSPIKGVFSQVNYLVSYSPGTCQWEDSLVKRPE